MLARRSAQREGGCATSLAKKILHCKQRGFWVRAEGEERADCAEAAKRGYRIRRPRLWVRLGKVRVRIASPELPMTLVGSPLPPNILYGL
jgi:hypothetical protein